MAAASRKRRAIACAAGVNGSVGGGCGGAESNNGQLDGGHADEDVVVDVGAPVVVRPAITVTSASTSAVIERVPIKFGNGGYLRAAAAAAACEGGESDRGRTELKMTIAERKPVSGGKEQLNNLVASERRDGVGGKASLLAPKSSQACTAEHGATSSSERRRREWICPGCHYLYEASDRRCQLCPIVRPQADGADEGDESTPAAGTAASAASQAATPKGKASLKWATSSIAEARTSTRGRSGAGNGVRDDDLLEETSGSSSPLEGLTETGVGTHATPSSSRSNAGSGGGGGGGKGRGKKVKSCKRWQCQSCSELNPFRAEETCEWCSMPKEKKAVRKVRRLDQDNGGRCQGLQIGLGCRRS